MELPKDITKIIYKYVDNQSRIAFLLTSKSFNFPVISPITTTNKIIKKYGLKYYKDLGLKSHLSNVYEAISDHKKINLPNYIDYGIVAKHIVQNKPLNNILNYQHSSKCLSQIYEELYKANRITDLLKIDNSNPASENEFNRGVIIGFIKNKSRDESALSNVKILISHSILCLDIAMIKLIYKVEDDIVNAALWYQENAIIKHYNEPDLLYKKCHSICGVLAGLCFAKNNLKDYFKLKKIFSGDLLVPDVFYMFGYDNLSFSDLDFFEKNAHNRLNCLCQNCLIIHESYFSKLLKTIDNIHSKRISLIKNKSVAIKYLIKNNCYVNEYISFHGIYNYNKLIEKDKDF